MKVSCLILTHNEERNLPGCLASLSWCDDILVIDSGSSDSTLTIASKAGARILHRPFDNFASQRNHGLDNGELRYEWVLHLDADEVLTEAFVQALSSLQPQDGLDAWRVPSKLMMAGRWLRHAGMYPVYQVRLGHRERLRFKQVGHGQREDLPISRLGIFPEPYLHFNFSSGMSGWLQKHVRYARDEAQLISETRRPPASSSNAKSKVSGRHALKTFANKLPLWFRPFARLAYVLILRQGFRDGRAGFTYAIMLFVYEAMISLFVYDQKLRGVESRND